MFGPKKCTYLHQVRVPILNLSIYLPKVEEEASFRRHQDGVGCLIAFDPRHGWHEGALKLNSSRHVRDPRFIKEYQNGHGRRLTIKSSSPVKHPRHDGLQGVEREEGDLGVVIHHGPVAEVGRVGGVVGILIRVLDPDHVENDLNSIT